MGKYFDKDGVTEITEAECLIRKSAGLRFSNVNGDRYQFSDSKETARDAEELAWTNAKPMNDWKLSMQGTDGGMPRFAEDILDGMANKLSVPQITLDRLQAKKDLRATKP
jgi:hypothetical protein